MDKLSYYHNVKKIIIIRDLIHDLRAFIKRYPTFKNYYQNVYVLLYEKNYQIDH